MENIYKTISFPGSLKTKASLVIICLFILSSLGFAQVTYTFTTAGATGQFGPTQTQINLAYQLTNLNGAVTINTTGIQQWVVPVSGGYRIEAYGAQGGVSWGMGAKMVGDFTLTAGTVLKIIVGQQGGSANSSHGSGGGGSFVIDNFNNPLVVAGGGGGRGASSTVTLAPCHGHTLTSGQTPAGGGPGGTGGGGGASASGLTGGTATTPGASSPGSIWASGGGGFYTNGGLYDTNLLNGGRSFFNNALGGDPGGGANTGGGFGGGGGAGDRGAGGGGYSGGGGGTSNTDGGGGGGSYNNGVNQQNASGFNTGNGRVIITALCNITLSAQVNPICVGNSATITTNAISNYVWSTGGTSSSIVVSPSVNTTYTLSATSPSNCTASAVITITVNNTPTVSAVTSASVVCLNKPVIVTAIGANTYTWTGGVTNGTAFTPTATSDYTVTGTNACGTSSAVVSVTVNPLPSITAAVNNPTVCSGNTIILNGGGSVSGYTWSAGAPNNTPFVPPASTNYVVTGAGANGCTNTAVASVAVLVTPTIVPVVTPTAICLGGTATLSATGATGYTWTPGTNLNTATVAVSPQIPTTYTVFRTNGACSNTSTVSLVVNALPLVNATATPSIICAGTGVNMVVVGPITNTWLPGGFTTANFTLYPNFSTNYTVTGSNGNCTATAVVSISVNPTPTVNISTSTLTICQGQNVTLTGGGALTYTWLPMNTNNQVEVVNPGATTLYTLTGGNSFGCTSSVNQVIVVNPLPNMNLTSNLPYICAGNTASLSIASPASNPNVVYNWSSGPNGPSILVSPTITTNYFATGTNTITGCQNTNTITLSVYISTFAVSGPTAICKGESAVFSAAGDASTYAWSANGSPVGNGTPSLTVSPLVNTTYYVVGTNVSCTSTLSVPLIVNPIPNVVAVAAKGQICRFEVSTIVGTGATSYSWNTGASTPTISFTLSVTTTYTLTGTDVNGCSKTTTVTQFVATCIGMEDLKTPGDIGLNIYPNPNNGNFSVRSDVNVTLSIVNALGQVVSTLKLSEDNKKEVTVSSLPTGVYFITGEASGIRVNKKIVIEK